MPLTSTGIANRLLGSTVLSGTTILASRYNADQDDIYSILSSAVYRDGRAAFTDKITGVAGTDDAHIVTKAQMDAGDAAGIAASDAVADDLAAAILTIPTTTDDLPDSTDKRYVTDAQRTALISGSFNGGYTYQTKALMDADTAPTINAVGYVVADTTAANNAYYQKTAASGSAGWTKRGALPWQGGTLVFQDDVIFDIEGLIGGSAAVYVPRQRAFVSGGTSALTTNGTESANLSGYVEIAVSNSTQTIIYHDADDTSTPYKTAVYPTGVPTDRFGRIVIIAAIWARHIHCAHDYQTTDEWKAGRLIFRSPMVVEGSNLLVPGFYRWFPNVSTSLSTFQTPADGSGYWSLDISTTTTEERRHYFDLDASLAGSTPVATATGTAVPRFPSGRFHQLARSINGRVQPINGYRIVGGGNGGVGLNEFPFTLGDDPDRAPQWFSATTAADVTDVLLTDKGFTRGFTSLSSNRPYAGGNIVNARPGYYFFARAWYQASADDTFATARVYCRNGTTTVSGFPVNGSVDEVLSARVRSYTFSGQFPETGDLPDNYIIGMENASGSTTIVCGLQFAVSPEPLQWIARGDYMEASSPAAVVASVAPAVLADVTPTGLALAPDIWLTEGRPQELYLANLFAERSNALSVTGSLWGVGQDGLPYHPPCGDHVTLDPDRIGSTVRLDIRHRSGDVDARYGRLITTHVAPATYTGSPKILHIGTSLTNRGAAAWVNDRLTDMGMTPIFPGTIPGKGIDDGDLTGSLGEGREGSRITEHIYETTGRPPFAAGTEATYLAKTKANKMLDMPFIRPATGGDDPAKVYNGYIFDLDFYLNRWTPVLDVPEFIIIELSRNDITAASTVAEAVTWFNHGLSVMVPQCRIAAPTAHIGILVHSLPRSATGDAVWEKCHAVIGEAIRYAEASGDSKVKVLPAWEHMPIEVGYGDSVIATDANTGTETREWSDAVHFGEFQRRVVAEMVSSWIVCGMAGL